MNSFQADAETQTVHAMIIVSLLQRILFNQPDCGQEVRPGTPSASRLPPAAQLGGRCVLS